MSADDLNPDVLKIEQPFSFRRRGVEMKILAGNLAPSPDAVMIRALRNAQRWSDALKSGTSLTRLASELNLSDRDGARVITLSGLSPKIQAAIVAGKQPVDLTRERLLRNSLPRDWNVQEQVLGFGV